MADFLPNSKDTVKRGRQSVRVSPAVWGPLCRGPLPLLGQWAGAQRRNFGPISWRAGQGGHMTWCTAPVAAFSCFWVAWHLENPLAFWVTFQLLE